MKRMALILIAVAVLAFAGGAVVTPLPVTPSLSHPQVVAASRDTADEGDLDAYGNEITHAVAEYSVDPTGSLYELHAPQVEIQRLASPKS